MRGLLAFLLLLSGVGLLRAAPVNPDIQPERRPEDAGQAAEEINYAQLLLFALNEVERGYARPVARADLAHAALTGLYEAARLPVPSALRAEVAKVKSNEELLGLLIRIRRDVGNAEPLQGTGALLASLRAMTRILDPHSGLLTSEELRRGGSGPAQGFGLDIEENGENAPVLIKEVAPGGPAQKAGLRPGDEITHVNGRPAQEDLLVRVRLRAQVPILDGTSATLVGDEPGDGVTLTVRRAGVQEPWQVKLERQTFRPETVLGVIRHDNNAWDYWIDRRRKIAHVRIAGLASGTAMELRQVVAGLKDEGLRGILLDLRWCPGGFLNEALDVAQLFLGECTVASVKSRLQGEDTYRSVRDESKVLDVPLVVLVNAETSGGAELIAAALQDNGRARIAGQRTRGKASIQTTVGLPVPSTGLKLTSGTFLRPSGKNLHRFPDSKPGDDWGVRPDPGLEVRTSAALSRQLKEWWLLQTLRPGPSREVLPLDDPHADPQRHAALQALVELIK
ncbi:MAG TPA: S41 family peptidase [Gemmataceae bacterium]|nr:S41 family peptidase [Gemmataceae bacterium]